MQRTEALEAANGSVNERGITGHLSALEHRNVGTDVANSADFQV
jgi:hypothetical protein